MQHDIISQLGKIVNNQREISKTKSHIHARHRAYKAQTSKMVTTKLRLTAQIATPTKTASIQKPKLTHVDSRIGMSQLKP